MIKQAARLYAQRHWRQTAELCQQVRSKSPEDSLEYLEASHLLGLVRKQQGRTEEAITLLEHSADRAPGRPDIQANYGNLLNALGRYQEAQQQYRKALSLKADFRPARLALARLMNTLGQFSEAGSEARVLLDANPQDAEALVVVAVALRAQGHIAEAETAYRQALGARPDYAVAHHNLGALLAEQSRSEEALAELESASECGVKGPELDFNRATALMALNRFDAAQQMLTVSATAYPSAVQPLELLSSLKFMRGHEDYAAEFARAAKKFPTAVPVQLGYAKVLHGAGDFAAAAAALNQAIEQTGPQSLLLAQLAAVQQEQSQFTAALDSARSACAAAPEDARLKVLEIDALMSLGRVDEALPLIQNATRREPRNQYYIALEADAARLLADESYHYLCDYDNLVTTYELEPPPGWSSIEGFNRDLAGVLRERHQFSAHPLDQSLRHGTQTPRGLLGDADPVIQAFLGALKQPIEDYRRNMGEDAAHPLKSRNSGRTRLRGCWSVRLTRGGYHVNHVHPQGWISSAYYVQVPPEVADSRIRNGWIKFGEPRFAIPGAGAEKFVQPKPGRLVLFPSYMWHGTTPILGELPRMTAAFDVITEPGEPHG